MTKETTFKLGAIQEAWMQELEQHPKRQTSGRLGYRTKEGVIRACCLGQALICLKGDGAWDGSDLIDSEWDLSTLGFSFKKLGLISSTGLFRTRTYVNSTFYDSLVALNDDGIEWPVIAAIIRANPTNVFNKSV